MWPNASLPRPKPTVCPSDERRLLLATHTNNDVPGNANDDPATS